jgi:hypothetical protein
MWKAERPSRTTKETLLEEQRLHLPGRVGEWNAGSGGRSPPGCTLG